MTLVIDEQHTAANYTAAVNVPSTWGYGPKTCDFITIHWWGRPVGQTVDSIIAWFCGYYNVTAPTSIQYVTSRKYAACLVSPWDAAWHAGGANGGKHGNVNSVGIEVDPNLDADTYETTAQVVAHIWAWRGGICPLKGHNYWTSTECPGQVDINRIYSRAVAIYSAGNAIPVPPKPVDPVKPKPPVYERDPSWVVDPGDTLQKIANFYGNGLNTIAKFNGIADPNNIKVGEIIWPANGYTTWIVEKGETLTSIVNWCKSVGHSMTIAKLQDANGINDPNKMPSVGSRMLVPM